MSFSKPNASAATVTTTRVAPSPVSGLCVTCIDGCTGYCEVESQLLGGGRLSIRSLLAKLLPGQRRTIR
ncbi:hypothetical protein ES703_69926 [subsurface metagenome]